MWKLISDNANQIKFWEKNKLWIGRRIKFGLAMFFLGVVAVCQDNIVAPDKLAKEEIGVVVNSLDVSLTVFSVSEPDVSNLIGLSPDGSPVSLALRGSLAVVPLGLVPAVAVVNLSSGILLRTIALPEGSGATGVDFLNDSLVLVANPLLNSVSPVNIITGMAAPAIAVGGFPHYVTVVDDRAIVLNANLGLDFLPRGPGTVSIIDSSILSVTGAVQLSGENPSGAVMGLDGLLYIINSGRFGVGNGSLSVVDIESMTEVSHHIGFGEFPNSPVFGDKGNLFFSSFAFGVSAWNPSTSSFLFAPNDAITIQGRPSSAGVGFDSYGRMYTIQSDCMNPSTVVRLSRDFTAEAVILTGICPTTIEFTQIDH
jgi:hypothetical protein